MGKVYVNTKNSANRPQYTKVLRQIVKDNVCPFCENYFLKYHTRPILKKGRHWIVTENMNPYAGTKRHILFVYRKHTEDISALPSGAAAELTKLVASVIKTYKLPGASLFMRIGNTNYTGASVRHLHANLLSGKRDGKKTKPIAVTLGFK